MRTVEEHQAVVTALLRPLGEESVALSAGHGRVLARDVHAAVALPGFDNSAMDGYAVQAADLAGASHDNPIALPVVGEIAAGRVEHIVVTPGTCVRIMTGAPMPRGAGAPAWPGRRRLARASG